MRKLLLLLTAIACATLAWSQCAPLVYDNFESGAMNLNWVQGGAYTRTFPTVGAPQGTTFLQQAGNSSHYSGSVWNFTTSTPSYISWWAMTSTNTNNCSYVVVGDGSTTVNNGIVFCYFTSQGTLRFYNNTQNFQINSLPNTWYHIELMNINFTTHTFDLYVNGAALQFAYPFRSLSTSNVNQIHMYNFDSGSNGYYDEIIVGSTPLSLSETHTDLTCNGDTNGTASVNIVTGAAPFTFLWSNAATTANLSGIGQGNYTVTVTDVNGCTNTQSVAIAEPAGFSDTTSMTAPTCSYNSDGAIDFILSGGTPGYSYLWSTGDTTHQISNLPGGIYTIQYSDSNGCTGSDTLQLAAPSVLTFTCLPTDVACNGQGNGALDVTTTGGTPGYTYLWSNGDTLEDLSGLAPGSYSLNVIDQNGCMFADTFVVSEPAAIVLTDLVIGDDGTTNGSIDLTVTGGVGPYSYVWSNGATTEDLTGLATGTYMVTVTDANGCEIVGSYIVDLVIAVGANMDMGVKAWPNPFSKTLSLQLPVSASPMRVDLYDLRGTKVFEQAGLLAGRLDLDLRAVAAGSYFLKVSDGTATQTLRVVKMD